MDRSQSLRRLGFPLLLIPTVIACVAVTPGLAGAESAEEKASPATVASGLQKIQDIATNSAKAVGKDGAKAEQLQAGIEPVWEKIEGTIKANDTETYVALEDNFTLLKIAAKAADASKASTASDKLSAAVKDYLEKHPGGAGSAEAPASDSRSAAAAEPAPAAGSASPDNLPRTGSGDLSASAGAALAIGGLALIGGARKRIHRG